VAKPPERPDCAPLELLQTNPPPTNVLQGIGIAVAIVSALVFAGRAFGMMSGAFAADATGYLSLILFVLLSMSGMLFFLCNKR